MPPQSLLSTVQRDVDIARRVALLHVDPASCSTYRDQSDDSGRGSSSDSDSPPRPVPLEVPVSTGYAVPPPATEEGDHVAPQINVVVSHPVQRPHQETCAVLVELTRPLPWLSRHARRRAYESTRGGRGGARRTATTLAAASATPAPLPNTKEPKLRPCPRDVGNAAGADGAMTATTENINRDAATRASEADWMGPSLHPPLPPPVPTTVPLLTAMAAFEIIFPAQYPLQPCQWHLFEEITIDGMRSRLTSSWAAPPRGGRHGTISDKGKATGDAQCGTDTSAGDVPTLTAVVTRSLRYRLLRWIEASRLAPSEAYTSSPASPFLLDFVELLRCWSAVELDVHHLLPSSIAAAYGEGGARPLRGIGGGTHRSGGGSSAPTSGSNAKRARTGSSAALATPPGAGLGNVEGGAGGPVASTPFPSAAISGDPMETSAPASGGAGATRNDWGCPPSAIGDNAEGPSPYPRRPARGFAALLLPLGEVAMWGIPQPPSRPEGSPSPTAADAGSPKPAAPAHALVRTRVLGAPEKILPSYIIPQHLLGTAHGCDWRDLRLLSDGDVDAALYANAELAKELHLHDVSDLFEVLRRLSKSGGGGSPSSSALYLEAVLGPALMETVRVLREKRLPLWAGVAACVLLQPESRSKKPNGCGRARELWSLIPADDAMVASPPLLQWRHRRMAELIEVVAFTERVLAVAQEYTLSCEARLVRLALDQDLRALQGSGAAFHGPGAYGAADALTGTTAPTHRPRAVAGGETDASARRTASSGVACWRLHAPISLCAVCGLSLLRDTVTPTGHRGRASAGVGDAAESHGALAMPLVTSPETMTASTTERPSRPHQLYNVIDGDAEENAASVVAVARSTLRARRAEGCLVVQCVRCGHGGHVKHISSWWHDPSVLCCPKGCGCRCVY